MAVLRRAAIVVALTAATPTLAQTLSYVGCYSSSGSLSSGDVYQYQSDGHCQGVCIADNRAPILGLTNGSTCLCGSSVPPASALVDDSFCNTPCQGFGQHMCGGSTYYSIYNTGTQVAVSAVSSGTSTTATATSNAPSVVTSIAPDKTIIVTQSATVASIIASATPQPKAKSNTAAIAGGVVGGVLLLLIAGVVIFFITRQSRQSRDDYQRHSSSAFISPRAARPSIPAMSQTRGSPETRYDAEAMANRRLSDGSIADNEDYSRRILQVTNPDDRG